jgi:hypothetical protein
MKRRDFFKTALLAAAAAVVPSAVLAAPKPKALNTEVGFDIESGCSMCYRGFSIISNGKVIGRITSWSPDNDVRCEVWLDEVPKKTCGPYPTGADEKIGNKFESAYRAMDDFEVTEFLFRGTRVEETHHYRGCKLRQWYCSYLDEDPDILKFTASMTWDATGVAKWR